MSTMPMNNNFSLDGLLGNPALQLGLGILGANTAGATAGQAIGRGGMMGLQSLAQQQRQAMMQQIRDEQIKVQQQRNNQIQSQMDLEAEQRAASKAALDNLIKERPDLASLAAIDPKAAAKIAFPQANQSDPFFQAVPTDSGLGKFNARTGEFELVMNPATGKPYVKSSDSPALQGSIAGAKARETGNYKPSDMVDGQILTETQIAEMARGVTQGQQSNPWQIPPEVQALRDAKAKQIIASEGGQGNMGVTPPMPYNLSTGGIKVPTKAEEAAQVQAAKLGAKNQAEDKSILKEMERSLPNLENVVSKLSDLGKKATYTATGRIVDSARRELGLGVGEGAVARKEYIATVANEILPLLRQTFGAAFTEREGESLKATLGDPNASPEEKDAVLRAFIDTKRSQIEEMKGTILPKDAKMPKKSRSREDILKEYGVR